MTISKMYEKAVDNKLATMGMVRAGENPGWYVRLTVDIGEGSTGFTVWATDKVTK